MTLTTDEIKELYTKLDYYESIFSSDNLFRKIQTTLKTTPQLASVVKVFLLSPTNTVTSALLVAASESYGRKIDQGNGYAKIIAWRIRKLLSPHGITITNLYNLGYSISDEGKNKLKELLK